MRVPTRSAGTRSGVNWTRAKVPPSTPAVVLIVSVFARPGTPSIRRWPCASRQTSTRSSIWSWPAITLLISKSACSSRSFTSAGSTSLPSFADGRIVVPQCKFSVSLPADLYDSKTLRMCRSRAEPRHAAGPEAHGGGAHRERDDVLRVERVERAFEVPADEPGDDDDPGGDHGRGAEVRQVQEVLHAVGIDEPRRAERGVEDEGVDYMGARARRPGDPRTAEPDDDEADDEEAEDRGGGRPVGDHGARREQPDASVEHRLRRRRQRTQRDRTGACCRRDGRDRARRREHRSRPA